MLPLKILSSILIFAAVFFFSLAGFKIFSQRIKRYEERYLMETAKTLNEMFLALPAERLRYLSFLILFLSAFLGFVLSGLPGAFIFGFFGFVMPKFMLKRLRNKRLERFNEQLVDGMVVLANSLKAGSNFPQAIELLVEEMAPPISQEFSLVLRENRMGVSLEKALSNMLNRLQSLELELIVTATLIIQKTGGNLAEMFDRIAATIRERNRIQRKIAANTAQGKMQGWIVGILPVVMGVGLYFFNPGLIGVLFTDPIGWLMLGTFVTFEILGFIVIKNIVTIEI